jgi:hypothetical protein
MRRLGGLAALMVIGAGGCQTEGSGFGEPAGKPVDTVTTTTPAPRGRLAGLAAARLPAGPGSNGPLEPPRESCFGGHDEKVDCNAPGGRAGVRACTAQRWSRSEVRPLETRPAFAGDDALFPGAVIQGKPFAGGDFALVPVPRGPGRIGLAGGKATRDLPAINPEAVQLAVAELAAARPAAPERTATTTETHAAD